MSGLSLQAELREKRNLIDNALKLSVTRGKEWAKADHDYRVALRKYCLEEMERGTPVSSLQYIARGEPEIADLKFKRDVAEALYKSAQEAINVYKIEIRIIDDEIKREWGTNR